MELACCQSGQFSITILKHWRYNRAWNNNSKLVGHSLKQEYCNRLLMVSPLEIYSKFGLANWIYLAKWVKLVGK